MEGSFGAHTINERTVSLLGVERDSHATYSGDSQNANDLIEFARWYQAIILTMDQATNVA